MKATRQFDRLQWSEKYSSGLNYLDNHRRNFLEIVNELVEIVNGRNCERMLPMVFHRLAFYVEDYFAKKEMAVRDAGDLPVHIYRAEHDRFTTAIARFHDEYRRGHPDMCTDLLIFLIDWFDHYVSIFGPDAAEQMRKKGYE